MIPMPYHGTRNPDGSITYERRLHVWPIWVSVVILIGYCVAAILIGPFYGLAKLYRRIKR